MSYKIGDTYPIWMGINSTVIGAYPEMGVYILRCDTSKVLQLGIPRGNSLIVTSITQDFQDFIISECFK